MFWEIFHTSAGSIDVNTGDGTLAFYEGSHNHHTGFGEEFGITDTGNWYKVDEVKINYYIERGCEVKRIKCPKGSMVLWDSRLIHFGVEPVKDRPIPNFRCVAYLCYSPRKLAPQKNIEKKRKAFEEMRMTTHWPCNVKLFPKTPRTWGAEVLEMTTLPPPRVSALGYDA